MSETKIEWTDHSISPIRARNKATGKVFHFCEKVSPGCANCYAESLAKRFGLYEYQKRNRDKVEFFLDEAKLHEVLRRRKPTKFFWEDCSDLFGDWVLDEWLDKCFAVMALTPHHTHQILTKRPERMAEYISSASSRMSDSIGMLLKEKFLGHTKFKEPDPNWPWSKGRCGYFTNPPWPLPQIWLGTSVENQAAADERIPHLLRCPAAVRFLSCEPLLGAVNIINTIGQCGLKALGIEYGGKVTGLSGEPFIDWCIIGSESGQKRRECRLEWCESLVNQCCGAGMAVFVKQLSIGGQTTGDIEKFPGPLRIRRFPVNT